jgi:hypothetical protein
MHNCKTTRERATELLLNGAEVDEILQCEDCRHELDALKETLRLTKRMIEAAAPAAGYWAGYHQRLKKNLTTATAQVEDPITTKPASVETFSWRRVFTLSVRVPVVVAAALLLVFAGLLFLVGKTSRAEITKQTVSIVKVPVEVPVVQEKIVTRVVYKQAKRQSIRRNSERELGNPTLAKSRSVTPITLGGFKPMDEVKLTVIKGASPDEK